MSNTVAVLLIIGSAVVGPIEAKPTGTVSWSYQVPNNDGTVKFNPVCAGRVMACWVDEFDSKESCIKKRNTDHRALPYGGSDDLCFPRKTKMETVSELCERAMREIGASPNENKHAVEPYKSMWSLGRTIAGGPMGVMMGVYCIPVPEGYRK